MAAHMGQSEFGLVVLLLGPKLSGKSSVGNIILGRQAFGNNTTYSTKATGFTFGKQVTVVDTPGWQPIIPLLEGAPQELQQALSLCGPPPDVVLLVLSVLPRFSLMQWESQLRRLHINVWERAIVLFTHTEFLGKVTIEEHIRREGRALQSLLGRCGNSYHVLHSHHGHHGTSQTEVQQLFVKMQRIAEASRRPTQGYMKWGMDRRLQRSMLGNQEQIEMRSRTNVTNSYNLADSGTDLRIGQRQGSSAAPRQPTRVFSSRLSLIKCPLSIILLGRRKSGKSSIGNCILGKKEFKTDTKTSHCTAGQGFVHGTFVTVVDTPGWSLFGLAKSEKVKMEISQSCAFCSVGSRRVFVLVTPIDSFTEKNRVKVENYLSVLGNDIWRKMLILFTFGDDLKGKSIEEHIAKQGEALRWLMQRCGHKHHVIETSVRDNNQQEQLIEKLQEV